MGYSHYLGDDSSNDGVSWMALCNVRYRGQRIAYTPCTLSSVAFTSGGAARRIATWIRRMTRTPSSPVTSAVSFPWLH